MEVDMEALDAAKTAAMTAYAEAEQAVADVEADQSADMDSYANAVEQRDEAEKANNKAQDAETVEEAQNYQKMAEEANTEAMKYAEMVRSAAAAAEAAAAAAVKRAETIAPVIARPNPNPNPAAGDSEFDNMIDRTSPNNPTTDGDFSTRPLTVDGSKVTHSDTKKFTMSSDAPAESTGFSGSIHTRQDREAPTSTRPMVMDEVTVYTDQQESTMEPFSGDGGVHTLDRGGTDGSTTDPHTALAISATLTTEVTGKNGMTVGALVNITENRPSAGDNMLTFGRSETEDHDIKRLNGTFDMAPGTYECATTCMVTINSKGEVSDIASTNDDLTFKPESGAMVPVPDTDYLTFGYWVRTSTPAEGDVTTEIGPFAGGKQPYSSDAMTAYLATVASDTSVSATYTGQAAGQFVHKTDVDGDGKGPVPTSSGAFTADANLTANFTNGTVGALGTDFQNAIHGTISNFKNGDGQDIEGWELTLDPAKFSGTVAANGGFAFSAGTSGGKNTPAGGWRGSFFGPATGPDGDDAGEEPDPIQPGSVAGEFLGHFATGHAVGAFGATKDKE